MARLQHSDEATSLFPYLSVLLCVIGCLFLGVVVVSTGRLSLQSELARRQTMWNEYTMLRQQSERAAEANQRIQSLLQGNNERQIDLEHLRIEVRDLESIASDAGRREADLRTLGEAVARLERELEGKRDLQVELTRLRDERLKVIKNAPKPDSVRIVGTTRMSDQSQNNDNESLRPVFIECRGDELILYPSEARVSSLKLDGQNGFQAAISHAEREKEQGEILILLIRPDGVKAFDRVHAIVRRRGVRYGFLPIPGFGQVDLSAFRN